MTDQVHEETVVSLTGSQVEALLTLFDKLSDSSADPREIGKDTYCCRYWVGDRDDPANPNRRKINIRTYTHIQADAICVLRRNRDFGTRPGGGTVSSGGCRDDDWPSS